MSWDVKFSFKWDFSPGTQNHASTKVSENFERCLHVGGAHVEMKTNHSSYICFFPSCLLSCLLKAVPSTLPVSKEVHFVSPFSPLTDSFTHCKATAFPLALFSFFQGSVTQALVPLHAFLGVPAWVPCWANYSALPKETSAWIWKNRQIVLSPVFTLICQFFFCPNTFA